MDKERCETCRFWKRAERSSLTEYELNSFASDELDKDDPRFISIGQCKRMPPTILELMVTDTREIVRANHGINLKVDSADAILSASVWPMTWAFDWCGEWQAAS